MPLGGGGLRSERGGRPATTIPSPSHCSFSRPSNLEIMSFQNIFLSVQSLKIRIFFWKSVHGIPFLRRMLQIIMKFNKNSFENITLFLQPHFLIPIYKMSKIKCKLYLFFGQISKHLQDCKLYKKTIPFLQKKLQIKSCKMYQLFLV